MPHVTTPRRPDGSGPSHVAATYDPLPVELAAGHGAWVVDTQGRRYLDLLAGYSALNFGHRHPDLLAAAHTQLDRLTLTSRAFGNDQLDRFCAELAELCGTDLVVPMNTGAEAVETAIKVARRWGYDLKGVEPYAARIVVFADNFHGRTTTIVGFSTDPSARDGFGPFTPGFDTVPFGDLDAVAEVLGPDHVAVLVEPVQGEAGVIVPPPGFMAGLRDLCHERNVLLVADEIQSGLGRTGATFACDHAGVIPDLYVLGKALGGGIVPLSAVVGRREVVGVIGPGEHGSTFGGNPLACAVGRAVLALLRSGRPQADAARKGERLLRGLHRLNAPAVTAVRGIGLWAGIDLDPRYGTARHACEALLEQGLLVKDAHERTIRLAPPLVIDDADIDLALERLAAVLRSLAPSPAGSAA